MILFIVLLFFSWLTIVFYFRNTEFNYDLVKNVLPLFIGTKDFRTFMAKPKLNSE